MFCTNCGTEVPDVAVFCPECGTRVAVARQQDGGKGAGEVPAIPANSANPGKSSGLQVTIPSFSGNISPDALTGFLKDGSAVPGKVVAAAQVLLALLSLLPMFSLNLIIYSAESSVFSLFPTLSKLASYAGSSLVTVVYVWAGAITIIWLAAVLFSVLDVVSVVKGAKTCGVGSALYLALGVVVLVSCFGVNAYIASQSVISMSVLSATPWAWVLTILSAVVVALLAKKGGFSKPAISVRR